jgi:hypothetical protein
VAWEGGMMLYVWMRVGLRAGRRRHSGNLDVDLAVAIGIHGGECRSHRREPHAGQLRRRGTRHVLRAGDAGGKRVSGDRQEEEMGRDHSFAKISYLRG